jgi:hypothetical protein
MSRLEKELVAGVNAKTHNGCRGQTVNTLNVARSCRSNVGTPYRILFCLRRSLLVVRALTYNLPLYLYVTGPSDGPSSRCQFKHRHHNISAESQQGSGKPMINAIKFVYGGIEKRDT